MRKSVASRVLGLESWESKNEILEHSIDFLVQHHDAGAGDGVHGLDVARGGDGVGNVADMQIVETRGR